MKRAIVVPLLLLTIAAGVASARAHEFIASSTGKTTLKMLTPTVFTMAGGRVECTGASLASGQVKTTKSTTLVDTTQFEGCSAFGLAATVSPARVRSTAAGAVSLLVTVTVKTPGGCEVKVPSSKNQQLHTIKYKNTNKGIEKLATVSGITSSGAGACTYAEESHGALEGDAIVGLVGGTLEWK